MHRDILFHEDQSSLGALVIFCKSIFSHSQQEISQVAISEVLEDELDPDCIVTFGEVKVLDATEVERSGKGHLNLSFVQLDV